MKKTLSMGLSVLLAAGMLSGCSFKGEMPDINEIVSISDNGSDKVSSTENKDNEPAPATAVSRVSSRAESSFNIPEPTFEDEKIEYNDEFVSHGDNENGSLVYAVIYESGNMYVYGKGTTWGADNVSVGVTDNGSSLGFRMSANTTTSRSSIQKDISSFKDDVVLLKIDSNVMEIGPCAFMSYDSLVGVSALTVEKIGKGAFADCNSLETYIALSDTVVGHDIYTSVDDSAFADCHKLKLVDIKNLTSVGDSSFAFCKSLDHFNVPKSVTEIGEYAFASCGTIDQFVFECDKPKLADNIFRETEATVYIPKDNDTWKDELDHNDDDLWHGGKVKIKLYDPEKGIESAVDAGENTDTASKTELHTDVESGSEVDSEEQKPVDWKTLYKNQLLEYTSQVGYKFGLLYIDEDDIPELVVTQTALGPGTGSLYTIYDGKIKSIGSVSAYGTFYYKEKGNLMMGYSLRQGYNSTGFTSIIDGEREYVHTFSDNSLSGESTIVYKMDDQEISKSEYDQKLNELQQGMSVSEFSSLPDVTDANIAAALG